MTADPGHPHARKSLGPDRDLEAVFANAGRNQKPLKAYHFLLQHAQSNTSFTLDELAAATGWRGATPATYLNKQWSQLVERVDPSSYRVKPDFTRLTKEQFLRRFTQKKPIYSEYKRIGYRHVIVYEFLLPLTRETQFRSALDELFYRDTLEQRIREIGLHDLSAIVARPSGESDSDFTQRVLNAIAQRFGGYSIAHVGGRFRVGELVMRGQAGDMLALGERYLVDETTASVRFIVPCQVSRAPFGHGYSSVREAMAERSLLGPADADDEASMIRGLFFSFFVEAVVKTVLGEEEIWLLETTHRGPQLFVWERQS